MGSEMCIRDRDHADLTLLESDTHFSVAVCVVVFADASMTQCGDRKFQNWNARIKSLLIRPVSFEFLSGNEEIIIRGVLGG